MIQTEKAAETNLERQERAKAARAAARRERELYRLIYLSRTPFVSENQRQRIQSRMDQRKNDPTNNVSDRG